MSLRGHGYHLVAWRHPDVPADASVRIDHYVRTAQTAERGKCDLIFFADGLGIRERDVPRGALARQGRAGWNVVTSWSEAEALNFNRDHQLDYATRYGRAREFVDVVKGLWDSWDTDAFLHDKTSGLFYDERKLQVLQHQGPYCAVRGPLNVAPAPQRHPVIVQAGASQDGRELAAATADVVYCLPDTLEAARAYDVDVQGRMAKYGRAPDDLKILPGLRPTVGRTTAEAHAKFHTLQALLHPLVALSTLASTFGELSDSPLDGPGPLERQGPQDLRSLGERLRARVRRAQPTIRKLSQQVAGLGSGRNVIGTAAELAHGRQAWCAQGACDGFKRHTAVPAGRVRRVR